MNYNPKKIVILCAILFALYFFLTSDFLDFDDKVPGMTVPSTHYIPKPAVHKGPLARVSKKTFLMMKTGVGLAHSRLPIHLFTTFKRFPNHAVYADGSTRIGNEHVIDVFEYLPPEIFKYPEFKEYLMRQKSQINHYNWDNADVQFEGELGWDADKYKNIPMLLDAYNRAPRDTEWFLMVDDDTYVLQHSLQALVKDLHPKTESYYIGSLSWADDQLTRSAAGANPNEKTYTKFTHGGSGILLSRALVKQLVRELNKDPTLVDYFFSCPAKSCCGDLALGFMIQELTGGSVKVNDVEPYLVKPDPFQGETIAKTGVMVQDICGHLATFHHLSPESIQKLYDWESDLVDRKSNLNRGVLFADFYNDFVLPYLVEEREQWNNFADSISFTAKRGEIIADGIRVNPSNSKDDCKTVCEATADCYMWRYSVNEETCWISTNKLSVGTSTKMKDNTPKQQIYSGWMIDRIRKLRASVPCDFLKLVDDKFTDTQDTMEGWFYRKPSQSSENIA